MRYHQISVLFVLAAGLLGSLAKPPSSRWGDMHTKHSWHAVPANWESLGSPPADATIDLYVALKPYRENALIDALYEVSVPGHPKYGAHLSKEQVAELVAPHPDTLKLVKTWLEHYGVPSSVPLTHGGSTLTLTGVSVTKANDLLGASYQLYRFMETDEIIVRTVGYALPAALHGHVVTVSPTTHFSSQRMQWQMPRKGSGEAAAGLANLKSASGEPVTGPSRRDDVVTTPTFLRWLYKTSAYEPVAWDQNVLGIVGYKQEYPSPTDLSAFMLKYRTDGAGGATFRVVQVNGGGYDPSHPHHEANLDVQYAEAMAYPTPIIFYSIGFTGPSGTVDWFLSWLGYILNQRKIPQTISTSYDYIEKDIPRDYALHVCYLFGVLGARGVSVLFVSGDHGVGKGDCVTNGSVQFITVFPATCPWVTSVGGTTGHTPEIAASLSGGGFSNYFARPGYQQQAVSTFLQGLGNRYKGLYNISGRGIPDISAQALGFRIFLNGAERVTRGTSGSAPIVAGMISLLNDYMLSEGMASLGWLNPWLYGGGLAGLNDITIGSNPGCNTDGFSATTGWDPVTGLGTPDFERLLHILSN